MNLASVAYNALLHSVGLGVFPYLGSKLRDDPQFWMGRKGRYRDRRGGCDTPFFFEFFDQVSDFDDRGIAEFFNDFCFV